MDIVQKQELMGELFNEWRACERCALAHPPGRVQQHVVFGEGNLDATVFIVGEAAGQKEDETGSPFQGESGKVIDMFLSSFGSNRDEVFISNVVAHRPTEADLPRKNRKPEPEEVAACVPRLYRQLEIVDPFVVVILGDVALKALTPSTLKRTITNLAEDRKQPRVPVITPGRQVPIERSGFATWHPSYLLRNWSMEEGKPVHQSFLVFQKAFRVADTYNFLYRGINPPNRSAKR